MIFVITQCRETATTTKASGQAVKVSMHLTQPAVTWSTAQSQCVQSQCVRCVQATLQT